ncbi:hypothetical protein [Cupriavidus necator]|uniref:hypothetical protein n=1 Tax=Cupriavidus necator TaxID=106590 RepID=UPI003BEEF6CC
MQSVVDDQDAIARLIFDAIAAMNSKGFELAPNGGDAHGAVLLRTSFCLIVLAVHDGRKRGLRTSRSGQCAATDRLREVVIVCLQQRGVGVDTPALQELHPERGLEPLEDCWPSCAESDGLVTSHVTRFFLTMRYAAGSLPCPGNVARATACSLDETSANAAKSRNAGRL